MVVVALVARCVVCHVVDAQAWKLRLHSTSAKQNCTSKRANISFYDKSKRATAKIGKFWKVLILLVKEY